MHFPFVSFPEHYLIRRIPRSGCGAVGTPQNPMCPWRLISKQREFKVNLWNALKSENRCHLLHFIWKKHHHEEYLSKPCSQLKTAPQIRTSDMEEELSVQNNLYMLQVITGSATQPREEAMPLLPLTQQFTKTSSTIICSNSNPYHEYHCLEQICSRD